MSRKSQYSVEEKVKVCERYLVGESPAALAAELKMGTSGRKTIRRWAYKYKKNGKTVFSIPEHNRSYTKEFKQKVVYEYLAGESSQEELALKYNISCSIVASWIMRYNNGIENKDYNPRHEVYAMKSRKTTAEERLEIVQYAIANNNDYKGAASKFSVPYANVYQWVTKYNKFGEDGLFDRRGKKASGGEKYILTEEEKKDIEIEKLKHELERANMVIEVLKKKNKLEEQFLKDSRSFGKDFCTKQSKNSK